MCLALPAKILSINPATQSAEVDLAGVRKLISTVLVNELCVGDYVLIHVGFALNKISPEEAQKTIELFQQAGLVDVSG